MPGCEEIPADVIEIIKKKIEVDTPLCRVKSGVDGLFVFPSVPSGEYTLVSIIYNNPHFVNKSIDNYSDLFNLWFYNPDLDLFRDLRLLGS